MTEEQLLKAFEQYTGYKLELEDVGSWIAFQAFCAGYELRDSIPTEYGLIIDSPDLVEYNFQNNAKEKFKFFLDEKNQPCLNIRDKKELIACFILDKDEFSDLIRTLLKLNTLVK